MSWINGDEGELDALATYLEAVQVFLRQHIHSRNDICCSTSFHLHMRDRHLHATVVPTHNGAAAAVAPSRATTRCPASLLASRRTYTALYRIYPHQRVSRYKR